MITFCYLCKRPIDHAQPEDFYVRGHVDQPVKRLQRDLPRAQRPVVWQQLPAAHEATIAA